MYSVRSESDKKLEQTEGTEKEKGKGERGRIASEVCFEEAISECDKKKYRSLPIKDARGISQGRLLKHQG
jgi:hypothetical protein